MRAFGPHRAAGCWKRPAFIRGPFCFLSPCHDFSTGAELKRVGIASSALEHGNLHLLTDGW
jgi:hypothetical protein